MKFPGFVYGSNRAQALTADQEDTINLYVEASQSQGATTEASLYPIPGVQEIGDATVGSGRAHFFMDGREFAVIGTTFYEISSTGSLTSRGTVAIDDNPATISSNGDAGQELFITSGGNGYLFDLITNTLTQIAALNGIATQGGMLDGYFLALDASSSTMYFSDLLDGGTWDPTNFIQRSSAPDPWLALKVSGPYIYLFGEQTSEMWFDAGTSPIPFQLHPSGRLGYGIDAPFSATVLGNAVYWIGGTREGRSNVLRASGFQPEVISTYALQNTISDYTTVSDALGDSYSDRGHNFYLLTFPTAEITWAWDSETGQWAKRGTWIAEESKFVAWRPRWHAFGFGQHRMLDGDTAKVYEMDSNFPLDVDDRPIRRVRRAPALQNGLERVFYSEFELDLEPGLGTTTGQGEDPQVMLRCSNDGGKTWGPERWRSAGKKGRYSARVDWHRLGAARRRVFEVTMSDPIKWRVTGAYLKFAQSPTGDE